jgi:hypothetical protein
MNRALVDLFFLHIVFANLLVGGRLVSSHDQVLHRFGMGVTLTGLAYIAWALAAIIRPTNLDAWVAVGVVPLMAAFIVLFSSWLMLQPKKWRVPALVVAGLAAIAFFVIRTFVLPSHPYFFGGTLLLQPRPNCQGSLHSRDRNCRVPGNRTSGKPSRSQRRRTAVQGTVPCSGAV